MNKKLRMLLFSAALLGLPFVVTRADVVDWMPIGDDVFDAGVTFPDPASPDATSEYLIATTGGVYVDGDRIWNIDYGYNDTNSSFESVSVCDSVIENTLNIYGTLHDADGAEVLDEDGFPIQCPLKIDGNVHIDVQAADAVVNFVKSEAAVESGETVPTILEPYISDYTDPYTDTITPGAGYSMVVFNVATGKNLTVNVQTDVTFRGRKVGKLPSETVNSDGYVRANKAEGDIYDMVIVFKGAGQTKFILSDGTIVSFDGGIDKTNGISIDPVTGEITWDALSNDAAGTKVFLCMDQTDAQVAAGQNKVVFERKNLCAPAARSMVYVGYNSLITYLSDNTTGLENGGTELGGHAALAFDPTNLVGSGRLILFLKGAYDMQWEYEEGPGAENPYAYYYEIANKYPFNDAAVIVAGHYVPDFEDASILTYNPETQVAESLVDYSVPAGITAKFNIVDNKYYADSTIAKPVVDDPANKRLLWVINDVQNHGTLASDPYWYAYDDTMYGYDWAWYNNVESNVRHGFIIGINGVMDVYDNTGLAYVAGALNQVDPIAEFDLGDSSLLKKRNPSALIIDNVDESLFSDESCEYTAGNPFLKGENARHAQILLRGNGVAYFMESAASRLPIYNADSGLYDTYVDVPFGYIFNFWARLEDPYLDDPIGDKLLDYDQALAVGEKVDGQVVGAAYNGWQLDPNEMVQAEGEGIHVLDVEGKLSTHGMLNTTIYSDPYAIDPAPRSYASFYNNGTIEMSSVVRDHTGREVQYPAVLGLRTRTLGANFDRPLLKDGTLYPRYNSPAMFLNFNAQLFDTILRHDDASKYVDGIPANSDPAYTGGEVYYFTASQYDVDANYEFSPDRFRMPEIRFFNSSFELHESACVSGVRFVVRDIPGLTGVEGNNNSNIKFFDHGDILDTLGKGFGRVLQFSSMNAPMADESSNYATESAFVNVYKGNKPVEVPGVSSTAQLTLLRGDEYPELVGVSYKNQNAHHLFMLSQPDAEAAHCNMMLGWPRMTTTSSVFYPDAPAMVFPFADAGTLEADADVAGVLNPFPAMPYDARTISTALPHLIFPLDVMHETYPANPGVLCIGNGEQTPAGNSDGDLITFGSWNKDALAVLPPITSMSSDSLETGLYVRDGIIYDSHGGKVTIAASGFDPLDPTTRNNRTPVTYFDTMIAKLLWNDWDNDLYYRDYQFSGIFDIPADQGVFSKTYAVQPWGLTQEMMEARGAVETNGLVRIDANQSKYADNKAENTRTVRADESGVEEMLIGWYQRDPLPSLSQTKGLKKTVKGARSASTIRSAVTSEISKFLTRATESPDAPIARPTYLFYIGPEDDIKQLRVAGATMADPFSVNVGGDGYWPIAARVREIVSQKTEADLFTEHFIGEGAHAVLFGEKGGTIGLGSRDWNENSLSAWNLLGKEYVSIAPLGDMTINLNSNLIVADNLPLIATTDFSKDGVNRLTFYSDLPCEVRVPAGACLDLSAFGQAEYRQEIEFSGQVRLVLEDGASIRFPSRDVASDGGVVLYFNDESQFVFEGREIPGVYASLSQTAYDTIKLIGKGDIWLNKTAKMLINGDVRVSVESDKLTPQTSITLSIQRQAACYVGDENMSGGTFQVGNTTNLENGEVRFTLEMNGPEAMFQINREGFFGLAAGLINKVSGQPNGDALREVNPVLDADGKAVIGSDGFPVFTPDGIGTDEEEGNAWQVAPLYNVYRTSVEIKNGIFQHSNIADGSDSTASIMAYGPAGIHRVRLAGGNQAIVRGGGNLMNIPWTNWDGSTTRKFYPVNIWDYAGKLSNGEAYTILGSAGIILNSLVSDDALVMEWNGGRSVSFDASVVGDWNTTGYAMFNYFGFNPYQLQQAKAVCLGSTQFAPVIGFVNLDTQNVLYPELTDRIVRLSNPGNINGDVRESLNLGYIDARNDGRNNADPVVFGNRQS
ncbi:MAG: hypothetical protein WC192_04170 [Candidatus Babeliales bacterium]|jgi:hypothetical protein